MVLGLKGRYAVILKKVEVNMVPHSRCTTLMKNTRLGSHFKLHNSFVCAGGEEGKDTCQVGQQCWVLREKISELMNGRQHNRKEDSGEFIR